MVHILGHSHDLVIYGPLRIWAERGLIRIEDARDNSFETLDVRETLLRLNGLNEMIGRSKRGGKGSRTNSFTKYAEEIQNLQEMIDNVTEVCWKAREQGMPTDPSAVRDLQRRKATSVSVPKKYNMPM